MTSAIASAQRISLEEKTIRKITRLKKLLNRLEKDVYVGRRFDLQQAELALKTSIADLRAARLANDSPLPGQLMLGERVLYINSSNQHYQGTVKTIAGHQAEVKFDKFFNPSWKDTNSLVRFTDCAGSTCIDQKVLYINSSGQHYEGIVKQAFENNLVLIKFDKFFNPSYKEVNASIANEIERCLGRFCVDDRIMYTNSSNQRYKGTITKIFDNGTVKVKFDRFFNPSYKKMKQLIKLHE